MSRLHVKGEDFDVELSGLRLRANVSGKEVFGNDADQLRANIAKAMKVASVDHEIPVVIKDGSGEYRRAILRGQNARNRMALMTIDGRKEQLDSPAIVAKGEEMTDEELAELNRLAIAQRDAMRLHSQYLHALRKRVTGSNFPMNLHVETLLRDDEPAASPDAVKSA